MKNILALVLLAAIIWGAYLLRERDRHQTDPADEASQLPQSEKVAQSLAAAQPKIVAPAPSATVVPTRPAKVAPSWLAGRTAFGPPPPEVLNAIVIVTGPEGAGTGFICSFHGKTYVATNQHVLTAGGPLSIRTSSGETMNVNRLFAAIDADIVLMECALIPPSTTLLQVATLPDTIVQKDDPIMVPGNSKGDGVVTQTPGKVLAIGPQRIEVDNPVYPGNSGSPIIDLSNGKVIGVLTEAELVSLNEFEKVSFKSRNSALKSTVRYFGHRIDSVQRWEPLDWFTFQQTEGLIKQSRKELDAMFSYFMNSSDAYKNFKDFHEAKNSAVLAYNDHRASNADKMDAYNRFLRDVERLARRAKTRLDNRKIYYYQKDQVDTINRMSEVLIGGTAIAKRDGDLVAILMDRGK